MNSKSRELSNMAAMREAVDEIKNTASNALIALSIGNYTSSFLWDIVRKCESALAEQKYEAKWKLGAEYEFAYCSHCGHQQWASWDSQREAIENIEEFHNEYKYCPKCGFEMKG